MKLKLLVNALAQIRTMRAAMLSGLDAKRPRAVHRRRLEDRRRRYAGVDQRLQFPVIQEAR